MMMTQTSIFTTVNRASGLKPSEVLTSVNSVFIGRPFRRRDVNVSPIAERFEEPHLGRGSVGELLGPDLDVPGPGLDDPFRERDIDLGDGNQAVRHAEERGDGAGDAVDVSDR